MGKNISENYKGSGVSVIFIRKPTNQVCEASLSKKNKLKYDNAASIKIMNTKKKVSNGFQNLTGKLSLFTKI